MEDTSSTRVPYNIITKVAISNKDINIDIDHNNLNKEIYSNANCYQAHPYHLVSPSPWPILTSISLLSITTSGVLSMHSFSYGYLIFINALLVVVYSMAL
jgi:hypothetical protein